MAHQTSGGERRLRIVQLGLGGVGQALVRHYVNLAELYPWLSYEGIADRSGLLLLEGGWSLDDLQTVLGDKGSGRRLADLAGTFGSRSTFVPASSDSALPSLDPVFSSGDRTS